MSRIRKAVIPAAGLGTRFLPATKAMPKEMLPIVDTPTIQYIIEEAVAAGIDEILIVTGRSKRAIEDHFDRAVELEMVLERGGKGPELAQVRRITEMADIHYVRQKEARGLGHAVLCARTFVGDEPFAVLLGDDVVDAQVPCLEQLISAWNVSGGTVLGVQEVPEAHVSRYGIVKPGVGQGGAGRLPLQVVRNGERARADGARRSVEGGFGAEVGVGANGGFAGAGSSNRLQPVSAVVEKPSPAQAPSQLAILGRYILSPTIFDVLAGTQPGVGGEIQLTDAIAALIEREPVFAFEFEGTRYDVGDRLGFVKATLDYALKRGDLREELLAYLADHLGFERLTGGLAEAAAAREGKGK